MSSEVHAAFTLDDIDTAAVPTSLTLPMPNATLTRVRGIADSEDFDYTETAGPDKWAGNEGIYYSLQTERVPTGTSSSVVGTRSIIAPADLNIAWSIGDIVTFTPYATDEIEATVRLIKTTAFPGVPGIVRIVLEDA